MHKRGGLVVALFLVVGAALPTSGVAQEPPETEEQRCVCAAKDHDEGGRVERCRCFAWPDSLTRVRVEEAMARAEEALERARIEVDPERVREAAVRIEEVLERARGEIGQLRLDTLSIFRDLRRARELRLEGDTILVWPPGRQLEAPSVWFPTPGTARFGLRLMDLNPDLGAYFEREEGVLVLEVRDDAPLELHSGDVILRIDGREVEDARHATSILQSYRPGERIRIDVFRRGRTERLEGRVP